MWPETAEQRDRVHKLANTLDKLPKRLQGKAKQMLHDVMSAETRADADDAIDAFAEEFIAKYPKAVECVTRTVTRC